MPDTPLALAAAQVQNKLRNKINGDFVGNKAHSSNFGLFVYDQDDWDSFFSFFLGTDFY